LFLASPSRAEQAAGDVVFVELPDEGTTVSKDAKFVVIDIRQGGVDILARLMARFIEVNSTLSVQPRPGE